MDSQNNPEQDNCAEVIIIPDLKMDSNVVVIKNINKQTKIPTITVIWGWHKNRHIDQWDKIKDPNMGTCNFSHLIFNQDAKNIHWRKEVPSANGIGKN